MIDVKQKVFAIGLNKTGTTSLHEALKHLGYRSLHDAKQSRKITHALKAGRTPKQLEEYDAVMDFPTPPFRALANAYPSAKYILNTRDKTDWINSRVVHVLHNRVNRPDSTWQEIDTLKWSAEWDQHHQAVREFFATENAPALLELDIPAGDGWAKLCPFLGLAIPAEPFPIGNTGRDLLRAILRQFDGRSAANWPGGALMIKTRLAEDPAIQLAQKIPGWMSPAELSWIFQQARKHTGQTWVELGSYAGRSLFAAAAGLTAGHLVSIDRDPLDQLVSVARKIADTWPRLALDLYSEDATAGADNFQPESVGALFVDAGHGAKSVEQNLAAWWPKIAPGGLVAGHDYNWPTVRAGIQAAGIGPIQLMANGSIWWTYKR